MAMTDQAKVIDVRDMQNAVELMEQVGETFGKVSNFMAMAMYQRRHGHLHPTADLFRGSMMGGEATGW
jgi:hypothetical protein